MIKRYLLIMHISKCFIEKIDGFKNNPENSPTTKTDGHIQSGFPVYLISSFKRIKNMHDIYTTKDYAKKFL